VEYTVGFLTY